MEFNLRYRDLLTHAGKMEQADQVSWYLEGLLNAPQLLRKVASDPKGKPWKTLDDVIAQTVQEDYNWRMSQTRSKEHGRNMGKGTDKRLSGPRVNAVQGKRGKQQATGDEKRHKNNSGGKGDSMSQLCNQFSLCTHCHGPYKPGHRSVAGPNGKKLCPNPKFGANCQCPACAAHRAANRG